MTITELIEALERKSEELRTKSNKAWKAAELLRRYGSVPLDDVLGALGDADVELKLRD